MYLSGGVLKPNSLDKHQALLLSDLSGCVLWYVSTWALWFIPTLMSLLSTLLTNGSAVVMEVSDSSSAQGSSREQTLKTSPTRQAIIKILLSEGALPLVYFGGEKVVLKCVYVTVRNRLPATMFITFLFLYFCFSTPSHHPYKLTSPDKFLMPGGDT